jgi:starvation-inducible DNA-binding protein
MKSHVRVAVYVDLAGPVYNTSNLNQAEPEEHSVDIDIGINPKDRKKIADGLSRVMADTYTLYLKTHNYHWNVTGPMFQTLHLMFEVQYNELWMAVDLVAERIRSLGFPAPGTYQQFAKLTSIEDEEGVPVATQMIRDLVKGHERVAKTAREVFPAADKVSDESTTDLLTQRLQIHEKTAWMLRSLLEDSGQMSEGRSVGRRASDKKAKAR